MIEARNVLLLFLLCAMGSWAAAEPSKQRSEDGSISVPLKGVKFAKGDFRLAASFADASRLRMKEKAYVAKVDGRAIYFFDLDGDRQLTAWDGLALEGYPFVVPMPEELLLASGQFTYRSEALRRLHLTPSGPDPDGPLFPHAVALTEVRIRAGLSPLVVDAIASEDASAHLDYLHVNRIVREGRVTMEVHREDPRREGYTRSGARAGALGLLGAGHSLTDDVMSWYGSVFHGVKLLDPNLARIGLAWKHRMSLLYPLEPNKEDAQPDPPPTRVVQVHPPDGARNVPSSFAPGGEIPSPVPERSLGAGTGFPLFVRLTRDGWRFPVTSFELRDSKGNVIPGFMSTPTKPAVRNFPRNLGCVFFIPQTNLDDGETYTASFAQRGMQDPIVWSFRTWVWEPKKR